MKNEIDLQRLEQIPESIRQLVPRPETQKVSFDSLTDSNIEKAVNYVKTKTLLDLLNPPVLS